MTIIYGCSVEVERGWNVYKCYYQRFKPKEDPCVQIKNSEGSALFIVEVLDSYSQTLVLLDSELARLVARLAQAKIRRQELGKERDDD